MTSIYPVAILYINIFLALKPDLAFGATLVKRWPVSAPLVCLAGSSGNIFDMGNSASTVESPTTSTTTGGASASSHHLIRDDYTDIESLQAALRRAGLESSSLIVGVDLTKSNTWTGRATFGGRNLHAQDGGGPNPYEQALSIIAKTLAPFDDDGLIPAYGFGCARSTDRAVVAFKAGDAPCAGFDELLARYRAVVATTSLAGPTSFGPLIRHAAAVVQRTGAYHILVIVADGQVTRGQDVPVGVLSPCEADTVAAIVEASALPLSIVLVGVGDGPWDMMREFDDGLPDRRFDNFQFVEFDATMKKAAARSYASPAARAHAMEAAFALSALMELPGQYRAIGALGLMDRAAMARVRLGAAPAVLDPVQQPQQAASQQQWGQQPQQQGQGQQWGAGQPQYVQQPGYPQGEPLSSSQQQQEQQQFLHGLQRAAPQYQQAPPPYAPPQLAQPGYSGGAAYAGAAAAAAPVPFSPAWGVPGAGAVPVPVGGGGGSWACPSCTVVHRMAPGEAPRCTVCGWRPPAMSAAAGSETLLKGAGNLSSRAPASRGGSAGGSGGGGVASTGGSGELELQNQCPICFDKTRDTVLGCGHQACHDCAEGLTTCHICRAVVTQRIRLYG